MNERVTIELDAEVLKRAQAAGLDLSDLLSRAVRRALPPASEEERTRLADEWYQANKEAIDASNELMKKHGLFSDGARMF